MIFIILLGLAGVLAVLFLGLFNMGRKNNTAAGRKRSQNLMRWRVAAQAAVLFLLILAAIFKSLN